MRKFNKFISIILVVTLLFSACGVNSGEKAVKEIEEYLNENQYNECLQYVNELEAETKKEINSSVLSLISAEYHELIDENNINTENIYALDTINNSFAENCRKLWHIVKVFTITEDNEFYTDFVYIHYFAEMCNYTKYGEIYSLLESVHKSGYLNDVTDAIYAYDNEGDNLRFDDAYKSTLMFDYSAFNPQEYLVSDYRTAHDKTVKALNSLNNGFATTDINVIASSMSDLEEALSAILHITDTLNAIHAKQISIFNELSEGNLNTVFNTEVEIMQRDFSVGAIFSLSNIFGENSNDDNSQDLTTNSESEAKITKNEALKIAVNAINKTKAYQKKLNVTYTQTKNIQMTSFDNNSDVTDAVELTKTAINQALENANGTQTKDILFNNGTSGTETLNNFIPPSGKNAVVNSESIKEYTAVGGSGGYVISLTLYPEASSSSTPAEGINSIINSFSFENSDRVSDAKTTYSSATVLVTVNNNGLLEKMEYKIVGMSDCDFTDENGNFIFEAQFTFEEEYFYEFEY